MERLLLLIYFRFFMGKKGWFLNTADKMEISTIRFCPPHTLPHRMPWSKKIRDEPCHIHTADWRMIHHILYCKILRCPNYRFMIEEYKRSKIK
jgi:hypothetical protein